MSPVVAACPSCGAPVEFRFDDTFVRVCTYCNAVVARGDRGFDSLGRLGDLAASQSPLALFAVGQHEGIGFQLVGRAQIQHPAGGGWEEWYARFDDGRWGWLSEAQGRFQLLFAVPDLVAVIPPIESLAPGGTVDHPAGRFSIAEVGEAGYRAAAGEMPYRLVPGERFRYADLAGVGGRAATIDYGAAGSAQRPTLYLGREVALAELHIAPGSGEPARAPETVKGRHVACPQCRGSLELRAPDLTQRVACPYCGALLDVAEGNLSYLRTLDPGQRFTPDIPLGSIVALDDGELTVIGCLVRHAIVDGIPYPFTEYLLYRPEVGYRWLVESAGHWTYAAAVSPGEVDAAAGVRAQYSGHRFRHFQSCRAEVAAIYGELYWKAEIGETVAMDDYVRPPAILSCERSAGEVNWSSGRWIAPGELRAAVRPAGGGSLSLPAASGVAPNQPFPHRGFFAVTGILLLLLLIAAAILSARAPNREVELEWEAAEEVDADGNPAVLFSKPFHLDGGKNLEVHVEADVDNSWVYLQMDLVNQDSGELHAFDVGLEYYHGYEDGESWSEGSRSEEVFLPPVAAGTYLLRVEQSPAGSSSAVTGFTLRQGVYRIFYLLLAGGALCVLPLIVLVHWIWFEKKRWSESDHAGGDS